MITTALALISSAVGFAGSMAQANAQKAAAKAEMQAAEMKRKADQIRANQVLAEKTYKMHDMKQDADARTSRFRAVAANSGGGMATDVVAGMYSKAKFDQAFASAQSADVHNTSMWQAELDYTGSKNSANAKKAEARATILGGAGSFVGSVGKAFAQA